MSLNYGIVDTLKLTFISFRYDAFIAIIISCLLLLFLLIINRKSKIINYILTILNILITIIILRYYLFDILSFKFSNFLNNMYFYFFNSVIYLIVFIVVLFRKKCKIIDFIFYILILINLIYSLFMTYYLKNVNIIVIGNIFPMIKFGNILCTLYYILIVLRRLKYHEKL